MTLTDGPQVFDGGTWSISALHKSHHIEFSILLNDWNVIIGQIFNVVFRCDIFIDRIVLLTPTFITIRRCYTEFAIGKQGFSDNQNTGIRFFLKSYQDENPLMIKPYISQINVFDVYGGPLKFSQMPNIALLYHSIVCAFEFCT